MKIFIFTCSLVIILIIKGFILLCFWNWFFIPLGLPVLSFPTCMGIAFFIGWLQFRSDSKELEVEEVVTKTLEMIVTSGFVLLIGYLLSLLQ